MPEEESFRIEREGGKTKLVLDVRGVSFYPSLADSEVCMRKIVDKVVESGSITTIVLEGVTNWVYPYEQVQLINEIREAYLELVRRRNVVKNYQKSIEGPKEGEEFVNLRDIVYSGIKSDPIGAYLKAKRDIRHKKIELRAAKGKKREEQLKRYISALRTMTRVLENTQMIQQAKPHLAGYKIGNRDVYRRIFKPEIKPNFMYTKMVSPPPREGEHIDSYEIGEGVPVSIYDIEGAQRLYHVVPPEFQLEDEELALLTKARTIMAKYKPKEEEFVSPERMRNVFFNISKDLIEELAQRRNIGISFDKIEKLARILVRLTVGFGVTEILLKDDKLEDVYINAPMGKMPIIVKHSEYGEMKTNLTPSIRDAKSWASRFRMLSGRPLDEANPVLDTELILPKTARVRVAAIQKPLSPHGYAFAFRRHREEPWTLPLYVENKYLSPLAAGLLSFLIWGNASTLIAGTRGSGKTSLLGASLLEIMRRYRIITIEDTLELPTNNLRKLGYDILPMKVRSAITGQEKELSASEGIRTALRLGDSCLIVGEVRSREAVALYEAMRVGAMANYVGGTIHGENPYGVFDRVVNDLNVPRTSFKATDIIVIANKLKDPSGLGQIRRVTSITEVRKEWEEDPLQEGAFVTLMEYDASKDKLVPTPELKEGESKVIKRIASKVREWRGNWQRVWNNILMRRDMKKKLVEYAKKAKEPRLLEAEFTVRANERFQKIFQELQKEVKYPSNERVMNNFEKWLKREV